MQSGIADEPPGGQRLSVRQLLDLLERNGCLSAADEIRSGGDPIGATTYLVGQTPRYDDDEARFLQRYVEWLHQEHPRS